MVAVKQFLMLAVLCLGLAVMLLGMLLDYVGGAVVRFACGSDDEFSRSSHVFIDKQKERNFDL